MYNPPYNRVDERDDIFDLAERARFGHLVSAGDDGMQATGLPWLLDRDGGPHGILRGHLARANRHWKTLDGRDVLVIFPLANGYVSPAHYASKAEHGKVVPTWNYEVVHAHGIARVHDDPAWVRKLVGDLTDRHESARADLSGVPRWAVTDAPADYVDTQLRAIVGVHIEITRLDGKRKLSQNRSEEDQAGAIEGLAASTHPADRAMAAVMRQARGRA